MAKPKECLIRGKQGKPVEFGHMIRVQQVKEKLIAHYEVFEKKPNENQLIQPALEYHEYLFRTLPKHLTADKGYYENMETIHQLEKKIEVVAIAKKGNRTKEETGREHNPDFKRAMKFRAGIEGSISFLKKSLGLLRCLNKGWEHFCSTVGESIFAHNLLTLSRMGT